MSSAEMTKSSGHLYTWGFCTHGQLGIKEKILGAREYVDVPTHAGLGSHLSDADLRVADCGQFHSIVVDTRGNVFTFGRNDRGQLGRGADDIDEVVIGKTGPGAVPHRVKSLSHEIVVDVACGAFHSLIRTADGSLVSWGWNRHGQLGRPTRYHSDSSPGPVNEAKDAHGPAKSLAAGFSHSAAVLASGKVVAWGSNEFGQLGAGSAVQHPEVAILPVFVGDMVASQVTAGDNHLLVLTVEGQVMAAGELSYGRLGLGLETPAANKERCGRFGKVIGLPWAEDPESERMRFVAAGGATSAAISTHGRLFTWGGGVWGQLGNGIKEDAVEPILVSNIPQVLHVDVAQEHIVAVCNKRGIGIAGDQVVREAATTSMLRTSSIWMWGRKRLIPAGLSRGNADPEAECSPVEVPLEMFGDLGALSREKDGEGLLVRIACAGSHTVVLGVPSKGLGARRGQYDAASWCPRMSTVTGPGTKGGQAYEKIDFRIVSRDEEGRDEKKGGLRFRIWTLPVARRLTQRSLHRRNTVSEETADPFELCWIVDRRDGTYDGCYMIRKPGAYALHVHMLPPGDDVTALAEAVGEPVSGSPFRLSIESGPAFPGACSVHLCRSDCSHEPTVSTTAAPPESAVGVQVFSVSACSEAVWEVHAVDMFGNPATLHSDRFVAGITKDKSKSTEDEASGAVGNVDEGKCDGFTAPGNDLAKSLTMPAASAGLSSAAAAMRETVRQRQAKRMLTRMQTTPPKREQSSLTEVRSPALPSSVLSPVLREGYVQVRRSSDNVGRYDIRWTPGAVGLHHLAVALLVGDESSIEQPIAGSPFKVMVVPGLPSAAHSRLLVGSAAESGSTAPTTLEASPGHTKVTSRIVLCDRMGNCCQDVKDPLEYVLLKVENIRLVEDGADQPKDSIVWNANAINASSGLFSISMQASADFLLSAANVVKGGGKRCSVELFVSANGRNNGQRLIGSPWRIQLGMDVPALPEVAKPDPVFEISCLQDTTASATTTKVPTLEEPDTAFSELSTADQSPWSALGSPGHTSARSMTPATPPKSPPTQHERPTQQKSSPTQLELASLLHKGCVEPLRPQTPVIQPNDSFAVLCEPAPVATPTHAGAQIFRPSDNRDSTGSDQTSKSGGAGVLGQAGRSIISCPFVPSADHDPHTSTERVISCPADGAHAASTCASVALPSSSNPIAMRSAILSEPCDGPTSLQLDTAPTPPPSRGAPTSLLQASHKGSSQQRGHTPPADAIEHLKAAPLSMTSSAAEVPLVTHSMPQNGSPNLGGFSKLPSLTRQNAPVGMEPKAADHVRSRQPEQQTERTPKSETRGLHNRTPAAATSPAGAKPKRLSATQYLGSGIIRERRPVVAPSPWPKSRAK